MDIQSISAAVETAIRILTFFGKNPEIPNNFREEADRIRETVSTLHSRIIFLEQTVLQCERDKFSIEQEKIKIQNEKLAIEDEFLKWKTKFDRYELKDTGYGKKAFFLKEKFHSDELPHFVCNTCFENGKRSILQGEALECYICGKCHKGFPAVKNYSDDYDPFEMR